MTTETLLQQFIAKRNEIGAAELAKVLDIKDSAVRMVCTGHYPNPTNILDKFSRHFINVIECPYIEETIESSLCKQRSHSPKPFGGAAKLAWWQACQNCPKKEKQP